MNHMILVLTYFLVDNLWIDGTFKYPSQDITDISNSISIINLLPTFSFRIVNEDSPSSIFTAKEGDTITVYIETTNIPNGLDISYNVSGIQSEDISSGIISSSLTINDNKAQKKFTLKRDQSTEGGELFKFIIDSATLDL